MICKRTAGLRLLSSVVFTAALMAACGGSETTAGDRGATGGTAGATGGTAGAAGAGAGGIVDGSAGSGGAGMTGGSGGVATGGSGGVAMGGSGGVAMGGSGGVAMGGSGGVAMGGSGGVATGGSGGVAMGGSGGVATGGSGGQGGSDGGMRDGSLQHPPAMHRATAEACDHDRAPVNPPPLMTDASYYMCHTDADCIAGENGRCSYVRIGTTCSYDTCFTDDDCTTTSNAGTTTRRSCRCGGDAPNVCTGGSCQTDADCNGNYCSPTYGSCGSYSGVIAYECHTAADECTDDTDCVDAGPPSLGKGPYCAFAPTVGHWKCSTSQCAG